MGVKVKQRKDKGNDFWVVVNHKGKRASFHIGSEEAANAVKIQLEAELGKGNLSCLAREKKPATTEQTFAEYALLNPNGKKQSSIDVYKWNRERYILPRFGKRKLSSITQAEIKALLRELTAQHLARKTIKLALASLSGILNAAVEEGLIATNPAAKLGKHCKSEKQPQKPRAMKAEQVRRFLEAALEDKYYPFFLIALCTGPREGEILALRWRHINFGETKNDLQYIHIEKRWYVGMYDVPKGGKERGVNMPQELHRVLWEMREQRMLKAFQMGVETIDDDLLFPGHHKDRPVTMRSIVKHHFRPILKRAGLPHFHFHELRHTYGTLLILKGAPLPYVRDQMGHSSIQVTVDTYCDLIGLAPDAGWVDHLNDLVPGATVAQPTQPEDLVESISHSKQSANSQKRKKSLKSLVSDEALDSKEDHDFSTSKSDKKRQKAQHGRNPDGDEL